MREAYRVTRRKLLDAHAMRVEGSIDAIKRRDGMERLEHCRVAAEAKSLAQLDTYLEGLGRKPTVEVSLELAGREIRSEDELERLLEDLRRQISKELAAHHRVRLR